MKHHIGITIDSKLFREIETLEEEKNAAPLSNTSLNSDLKLTKKKKTQTQLSPSRKRKVINHPYACPMKSAAML